MERAMRHYLIYTQRWFQITWMNPSIELPAGSNITQRRNTQDPTGIEESFWEKTESWLTLNVWKKFPDRPRQRKTYAKDQLSYWDHHKQLIISEHKDEVRKWHRWRSSHKAHGVTLEIFLLSELSCKQWWDLLKWRFWKVHSYKIDSWELRLEVRRLH